MSSTHLPINDVLPQVRAAYARGAAIVLKAPPGAGKTTGVPPAVMSDAGQVWVVQPRRLAARSVAQWIAKSLGESVGQTVGYHVRFDRQESRTTRIVSMTTGMFLRRMQSDPLLECVACVVLDEFHERTIEMDLALSMTQRLRTTLRDDLRLVVMSATLEPQPIVDFLSKENAQPRPVAIECQGRSYPVGISYRPGDSRQWLDQRITPVIEEATLNTDGHVLVFLPGVGDIRRTQEALSRCDWAHSLDVFPLHGSLSLTQQDAALRRSDRRRIVLATNIAETSVTVAGVTAVVDSGLAKVPQVDSRQGITRLETLPISLASADQRAGRAGRTGPGECYRVWDKAANSARKTFDEPEIVRGSLNNAILLLASLGESNLEELSWLTQPTEFRIQSASHLLRQLGAIQHDGRISSLGNALVSFPLDVRLARFAVQACSELAAEDVAIAAALLSDRDPFERTTQESRHAFSLTEKVARIKSETPPLGSPTSPGSITNPFKQWLASVKQIKRAAKQIERSLERQVADTLASPERERELTSTCIDQAYCRALLAAYPDRVTIRRAETPDRGLMVGGGGVRGLLKCGGVHPNDTLMVCWNVDGDASESRVRDAFPIEESWLEPSGVETRLGVAFDTTSESIRCRKQVRYHELVLREMPTACEPNSKTGALLFAEAQLAGDRVQPDGKSGDELREAMERIRLVANVMRLADDQGNEIRLDDDDSLFDKLLKELCQGRSSFSQLRDAPWLASLQARIGYAQWQQVEREAPSHLVLPSGNRTAIHYAEGKSPWMQAKIQECFGWSETPRILGGRVAVQMHLLGPNRRVQQITEDLASFWQNTYTEIRKELRRRYPKHYWPEDPTQAEATRNGLKPR